MLQVAIGCGGECKFLSFLFNEPFTPTGCRAKTECAKYQFRPSHSGESFRALQSVLFVIILSHPKSNKSLFPFATLKFNVGPYVKASVTNRYGIGVKIVAPSVCWQFH